MTDVLDQVEDVRRIHMEDGDTIVVRCQQSLSDQVIKRLADTIKERFPNNHVLILDSGLSLDVLGPTDMAVAPGNDRTTRTQRDFHDW